MTEHSSTIKVVEFFHLALLEVFQVRLNQNHYILKGGANLRYFYSSPRYSEDVDFDAVDIDPAKLEERVDGTLKSRPLTFTLHTQGVAVGTITKPKQTATPQRWKLALAVPWQSEPIRTKIEFSHRIADPRSQLEPVPEEITEPYALRSPTVRRYLPDAMVEQKIQALVDRAETQARDVFDLDLLFRQWPGAIRSGAIAAERLEAAAERVVQLPYESYRSLVVRFLSPDVIELYNRPPVWEQIQAHVVEKLMALK